MTYLWLIFSTGVVAVIFLVWLGFRLTPALRADPELDEREAAKNSRPHRPNAEVIEFPRERVE